MSYTRKEFINLVSKDAVEESKNTKIVASVIIAQACLESRDGNSSLAYKHNNLFGIKGVGPKGSVKLPTKEQDKTGKEYTIMADFRVYNTWRESISDHSKLLVNGVSWNRDLYKKVIGVSGKEAAWELQQAGYATDKKYAEKLISLMDTYNLYQYDTFFEGDVEMTEEIKELNKKVEELIMLVKKANMEDFLREENSDWATSGRSFITDSGISDGARAGAPLTREEAWMMFKRYHEKLHKT